MDGNKRVLKGDFTTHFFVTVIETEKDSFEDSGDYNKEARRTWGYTDTFEKAERAVLDNYSDIHECCYQWVIIEEHVMDVFAMGTGLFKWYHWNKEIEGYERCGS